MRFNTSLGTEALVDYEPGESNTAIGYKTLTNLYKGNYNTAAGSFALHNNRSSSNTAVGSKSMYYHKWGSYNTALGSGSLRSDTTGSLNTAIGHESLKWNNSGNYNTAVGVFALDTNTTGNYNVASGYNALTANTSGEFNSAFGVQALHDNTTGHSNTAIGLSALYNNQNGNQNTAMCRRAGYNCTGSGNIFIGYQAGYTATGDDKLYIDNDDNAIPLIFGNFSNRRVGLGSNSPDSKLDVRSSGTTEDPLRVRVGSASKLRVHAANGSVSVGTSAEGPANGLVSEGNIEPNGHKGADLGADGTAWDDIYYDDLHTQGASAFNNRVLSEEILEYPPKAKTPGSFDYQTERGDVELDPASMPKGLADENSLLTDEIASYNYKTNYEQQLMIEKLKKENIDLKVLLKKLEDRMAKLEGR